MGPGPIAKGLAAAAVAGAAAIAALPRPLACELTLDDDTIWTGHPVRASVAMTNTWLWTFPVAKGMDDSDGGGRAPFVSWDLVGANGVVPPAPRGRMCNLVNRPTPEDFVDLEPGASMNPVRGDPQHQLRAIPRTAGTYTVRFTHDASTWNPAWWLPQVLNQLDIRPPEPEVWRGIALTAHVQTTCEATVTVRAPPG